MINEYKKKSNMGIGLGLLAIVIVFVLAMSAGNSISQGMVLLIVLIRLVGAVFWVYGCWMYAKAKGYSGAVGLLGLLFLLGLIILVVLPDKAKEQPRGFAVLPPRQ